MSEFDLPDTAHSPEPKRRLFSRGEPPVPLDPRIEATLAASHRLMMERLEEGLEAIEETAASLMRDIAADVWKAGGAPEDLQSRIVEVLSKDQAIRGLVAHSDERFQALDIRMSRIEGHLDNVDRASALLAELVESGKLPEGSGGVGVLAVEPRVRSIEHSVAEMREYLAQLGRYLGERDQAMTQWLQQRAAALMSAPSGTDDAVLAETEARLRDAMALHVEALHERLEQQAAAISDLAAAHATMSAPEPGPDRERDSSLSQHVAELSQQVDERLVRLTELVNAALGWAVDEIHDHVQRETLRSVQVGMADVLAAIDRRFVDLDRSMVVQVDRTASMLTDRIDEIDRRLEAGLTALEEAFAERAGEVVEQALESATAQVIEAVKATMEERITQLAMMIRSDNRALAERLEVVEQQAAAKQAIRAVNELAAALPGEISTALDERLALIGDLIKRETRSYGDVVIKATGALADRIDRTAERIGDRFDREVETVVDQIGGTMATIATGIQRAPRNR